MLISAESDSCMPIVHRSTKPQDRKKLSFQHRFGWGGGLPVAVALLLVPLLAPPNHHGFCSFCDARHTILYADHPLIPQTARSREVKLPTSVRLGGGGSRRGRAGAGSPVGHPTLPRFACSSRSSSQLFSCHVHGSSTTPELFHYPRFLTLLS